MHHLDITPEIIGGGYPSKASATTSEIRRDIVRDLIDRFIINFSKITVFKK